MAKQVEDTTKLHVDSYVQNTHQQDLEMKALEEKCKCLTEVNEDERVAARLREEVLQAKPNEIVDLRGARLGSTVPSKPGRPMSLSLSLSLFVSVPPSPYLIIFLTLSLAHHFHLWVCWLRMSCTLHAHIQYLSNKSLAFNMKVTTGHQNAL